MQHAVVQAPVPNKEELGFRRKSYASIFGATGRCWNDSRVLERGPSIRHVRGVQPTNLVSKKLPYSGAADTEPPRTAIPLFVSGRNGNTGRGSPIEFHSSDADDGPPEQVIVFAA
jgi:hypothetical protein